jgi:iron complex transport system substrate-binding protein
LAGRFTRLATREMLKRLGYRVVELESPRSLDDAVAQIRQVASLLGHPERGEALAARIAAAEADAEAVATLPGRAPTVAVYQRRGYVTGADTLTSALLDEVGLANVAGALVGAYGGFVPLERLVADAPDYLIVAGDPGAVDQGAALLDHPALVRLYPPERRIVLPERLTVCAGPSLPDALDYLAGEARRIRR